MRKKIWVTTVLAFTLAAVPVGKASAKTAEADWEIINNKISAAASGNVHESIDVTTGKTIEISAETLKCLAGKNVTLAAQAGDGIAISVTGSGVSPEADDLRIVILDGADTVPSAVGRDIESGALYSKMFFMEEAKGYRIPLNIHFALDKEYAGKYASLYYYDERSGKMVCSGSFIITGDGMVMFPLERGDEYLLAVTENLPAGGMIRYSVAPGDCLVRIAGRFGVSVEALLAANPGIRDARTIYPGQIIAVVKS